MRSPFDSYLLVAWCAAAIVAVGCGDGGGAAAREGRVRIDSLDSPALGVRKRYVVYLPREYQRDSLRRFPVAYYLHGAGENEWSWVRRGGIAEAADSLMNAGAS
ncbi:MAG TPA: hypothetical protein VHM30_01180, partial [Gemmatimonadaceae bacterium]|nr:hypothetical protein [Gemmatimonadaceae bacterium]